MRVTVLTAALWYATLGLPVFPLAPGKKTPLPGSHGVLEASCDPTQIHAWFDAHPNNGVGIATGHTCDVIDVDGAHGANQLFSGDLTGDLLILGIVKTLKPYGWHVYIPPQNLSNSVHLGDAKDTDYRGRGGYVVAPPTCINDTTYTWHALYQPDGCTTCEYCDLPLSKWDTPHTTHSSCGLTTPPSNIYPRYTNETLR